ncbi:MAG: hypothetical protein PVI23_11395 [Maricaulaceae bacterium]
MNTIRKDSYVYPGFELAGVETPAERAFTRTVCFFAHVGAWLYDTMAAPTSRR